MKQRYFLQHLRLYCLLVLLVAGLSLVTKAQPVNLYGFTQSVGTYTPITGGTVLGNTTTDDQRFVDPAVPLGGTVTTGVGFPIGFNFTYGGIVYDRIAINANGWVSLGQSAVTPSVNNASTSAYTPLSSVAAITPVDLRARISGIGRDIQAQAGAELRIETIGTAPNRVCVVQWTNYRKFNNTGDNLNFQIRLNETTNVIDVIFGTMVFNATTNTADVGLGGTAATDFNDRTTTTDWNATTLGPLNTSRCTMLNTVTAPVTGRTFTWTPPVPCTGTPSPGNTVSSSNPACSGVNFILSLQNNPALSGLTYQWQSSPDGTTWTNIAGGTGVILTTSQTAATWYQCIVTCSGGGSATSTPLQVTMANPTSCYCIPPATNCNLSDVITNVTVAGINNNSTCSANGYINYVGTVAPGTAIAGVTYPMSVTVGPGGTEYVGVWIDYNVNGLFEASEFTALGSGNGVTINGNITIPATATLGPTRMRVRVRYNTALTGADACIGYTFGETEDYAITINPCIPVALTTQPANATISCGGNATFTVAATGSAPAFKWQVKTSASAFWTDLTNTAPYSGVTTTSLTISSAPVTMNGYKYRCLYSGPCRAIDSSNVVTLTVNQLVATVNPASADICNGSTQQLTITNITSPIPNTASICSGPISVPVPDNSTTGATHVINVSTIPAAAVITGISVTINMTHTWDGDMVFALKSPSGQIINLDYYLTATGGAGATTGFTNTIISSAGTTALSAGTNPYTGTFRADLASPAANPQSGPTGFIPTTQSWATMMASPANGAWTLGMYDGGGGDLGTLTSWCINFNYLAGTPATGAWTGAGIFTDPGATIPYVPGTQLNTVYVHPTVSTTYSVVVTTPVCVSGVTNIPINVSNPVGTVTAPSNATICATGNTSFTVSAASGNTIAYQWQVSTDAGTTWTNIANNSIYGGATTATLTLNGVPVTYSNYRYRAILSVATCSSTVTSAAATLTVNPLPVVTLGAAPYTALYPGQTTIITPTVTPNAGATYQWYKNGAAIPGATNSTISVDVDGLGVYTVFVTDVNGCSSTSSSIEITAGNSTTLFIYPSPNTGQFQVRYQNATGNVTARYITIYDSKGARVYSKRYSVGTPYGRMDVDLSNHGHGIYRVELGDQNGKRIKAGNVLVL